MQVDLPPGQRPQIRECSLVNSSVCLRNEQGKGFSVQLPSSNLRQMSDHFYNVKRYSFTCTNPPSPSQSKNAKSNFTSSFQSLEIRISSNVFKREVRMKTTQEIPQENEFRTHGSKLLHSKPHSR